MAEAETRLSKFKIKTVEDARLVIKQSPGKAIEGLGELPKVEPLEDIRTACQHKSDAPHPDIAKQALEAHWDYGGCNAGKKWSLKSLAIFSYWQLKEPRGINRSLNNGDPEQIVDRVDQLVGHHKYQLIEACKKQLPQMADEFEQYRKDEKKRVETEYKKRMKQYDQLEASKYLQNLKFGKRLIIDSETGERTIEERPEWEILEMTENHLSSPEFTVPLAAFFKERFSKVPWG